MSIVWLSVQEKDDMEKSKISLVLKAAQIIVQSRLGNKMEMKSKAHSSVGDCFNLAVTDIPSIYTNASRAFTSKTESDNSSICIEISLRTDESEIMVLELWRVMVHQRPCPTTVTYAAYNRMCTILKSLLSVTRVAPAYKLCRQQGSESYVVSYAMHSEPPKLDTLGPGHKHTRIGCSPPAQVDFWWRTDMTLSHHAKPLLLKSEHFILNFGDEGEEREARIFGAIKAGAFVDRSHLTLDDRSLMIGDVPFASLLTPSPPPSPPLPLPPPPPQNSEISNPEHVVPEEKEIFVQLKSLFDGKAVVSENGELEALCLACSRPPPLAVFTSGPTLAVEIDALGSTLQAFENNIAIYDELMHVLQANGTRGLNTSGK